MLQQPLDRFPGLVVPPLGKIEQRIHGAVGQEEWSHTHGGGIDKAAQFRMEGAIAGAQEREHIEKSRLRFECYLALADGFAELFQRIAKAGKGCVIIASQKGDRSLVGRAKMRLA